MPHSITITHAAARQLGIYLNAGGLFDKTADIFNVGILLNSHLAEACRALKFDLSEEEKKEGKKLTDELKQAKFVEWVETVGETAYPTFDITESQREAIKGAFKTLAEKRLLNVNKETVSILTALGLAPE